MNILITGGAGYIGAITSNLLLEKQYKIGIIDSLDNGHRNSIPKGVPFFKGNILNAEFLNNVFKVFMPQSIIHFASFALVEESFLKPLKYYKNNVVGSFRLFSVAAKYKVKNIIFSSSAAVYGKAISIPISESHSTIPISPYGETKLAIEKMLKYISSAYKFRYVCLRYFNVAGATFDAKLGENHTPETHLIPNVLNAALLRKTISINGNSYDTSDGTCIRDYIHVEDLANAHILVLESLLNNKQKSYIYNVGSGRGYSNKEIIKKVEQIIKKSIKIKYKKRRFGDPPILIADPGKIETELGFETKHSNLETIIQSHWNWYIKNFSLPNL